MGRYTRMSRIGDDGQYEDEDESDDCESGELEAAQDREEYGEEVDNAKF